MERRWLQVQNLVQAVCDEAMRVDYIHFLSSFQAPACIHGFHTERRV